jgi:hypothetical protein
MSFRALAFSFRIGDTTVGRIVKETVKILWEELQPLHTPVPTTKSLKKTMQMNLKMSGTFMSLVVWMANIRTVCPTDPGAMFNYKTYFSVVQGLVDANY